MSDEKASESSDPEELRKSIAMLEKRIHGLEDAHHYTRVMMGFVVFLLLGGGGVVAVTIVTDHAGLGW